MRFLPRSEPREEELAALADDSLPAGRREAVEAMVAGSPELAERLEEQRRTVALLRGAAAEVAAPAGLRARVEARRRPRASRRYAWAGAVALAAAAAALAVVLALPESVGGPTVAEAAVLATRPPTAAPPQASSKALLAASVEGLPFPNWTQKFGWKATGIRTDELEGRSATTVFYEKNGRRIGYTIFAGDALQKPDDAQRLTREGVELRLLDVNGRNVVTWLRRGHTCILSSADTTSETLARLAAWTGKGAVPF